MTAMYVTYLTTGMDGVGIVVRSRWGYQRELALRRPEPMAEPEGGSGGRARAARATLPTATDGDLLRLSG